MSSISLRVACLSLGVALAGMSAVACGDSDGSGPSAEAGAGGEASGEGGEPGAGGEDSLPPAGAPGDAGAPTQAPLGLRERLDNLGAQTDLEPEPVDPDGNLLPAGYHPLRKPFATIDPHQEIYFAGPQFTDKSEGIFDDGFDGVFEPLLDAQSTPWQTATYRTAVAGDFNGDGIQEFMAVYYDAPTKQLMAKVIWGPRGAEVAVDEDPFPLVDVPTPSTMSSDWFQHSVTAGNVDDDPADELWVGFYNLYCFDDFDHDMAELHREDYGTPYVAVTTGDFDAAIGDGTDEFFVMYTVFPENVQHYQVFDGLEPQFGADGRILRPTLTDPANTEIAFRQGFAVAGQFDRADPQQEIAILSGDAGAWRLFLMDDAEVNYRTFDSMLINMSGDSVVLAAADIDGDGIDEVACDHWIFDKLEDLPESGDRTEQTDLTQVNKIPRIPLGFGTYQVRGQVSVTEDYGVPERRNTRQFVALQYDDPVDFPVVYPPRSRLLYSARNPTAGNQLTWVEAAPWALGARPGDALAVGNVDEDSAVVKFTGEHELLYAEPEMIVAMAAPPFYADSLNQNEESFTSFGKATATGAETLQSVGFSVGFSVGYENKDPFGNGGSFKVSLNQQFDSYAKQRLTVQEWVTYTTGAEDSVVFTVVPFDVYYYEVVSAPNPDEVGNALTINLPRKPQTMLASATYFDQFVGESRKSAPLFATHVVGDPLSYPDVDERDTLCDGDCFSSGQELTVGQGSGYTQVDIMKTASKSHGTAYKLSVEVESEVSVFGVTAGRSLGFSYGYGMEITTEETTIFTGRVGSIEELTPETTYNFGLFAHKQAHPTSLNPVVVVDYWVTQ